MELKHELALQQKKEFVIIYFYIFGYECDFIKYNDLFLKLSKLSKLSRSVHEIRQVIHNDKYLVGMCFEKYLHVSLWS